jgi:serine/threonine protein kinase/Tfp pilus assembly protein PilF
MTPERWQQVEEIFQAALDTDAGARAAFVAQACGGDDELRREVGALLAYERQAEHFIEKPVLQEAAERLAESGRQPGFTSGERLGHYQVVSLLGKGGMGEVYLARDLKLGREVAIKILPAEFAADPDRLARFEREARLLSALNHDNIAAIYAIEQDGPVHFIVLEYVPGVTLAEHLENGPLPIKEALSLLDQIADALEFAHGRGIIHRDLKPANIKVTPQGRVKVLDFGLAKISRYDLPTAQLSAAAGAGGRTVTVTMTGEGMILGTVPYMSPEQTRGQALDRRTDVWAFGCLCYETLAGARPFGGATTADTLAAILSREPDWRALPKNTPAAVADLIRRCLQKDHHRRLPSAGEAEKVIAQALSDYSPLATRLRRARWGTRLALAAAVVVVLLASFVTWRVIQQRGKTDDLAAMLSLRLTGDNLDWALSRLAPQSNPAGDDEEELSSLDKVGNLRAIDETIQAINVRLRNEPRSARLHAMLSQAHYLRYSIMDESQDKEAAVQACERALKLGHDLPEVQVTLGNVLVSLLRYEQAGEQFRSVLAKDENHFEAKLGLARVLEATEKYDEAERLYLQAVSLRPDYWGGYNELGAFYFAQGRYLDAVRQWEQVTRLHTLGTAGLTNLGNAYYQLGQVEQAQQAYRQSLNIRHTIAASVGLGVTFYDEGKYAEAADEFREAMEKAPRRPELWGNYADACLAAGRKAEAMKAYDKASELMRDKLKTVPEDAGARAALAEWLAKRGETGEALGQIEQALKQGRLPYLSSAVIVYHLAGRRREALEALNESLNSGYSSARHFDRNPELSGLRADAEYSRIVQARRGN